MTNERTIDIGVVLRGVQILPLPEAWTVVEAVCFVKCLGEDGFPRWALRRSDGINDQELLGVMTLQRELLVKELLSEWGHDA